MSKLALAIVLLLMAPALKAQQNETKENPSQAETQATPEPRPSTGSQDEQNSLPVAIRPGHALDPADVDILTGKKDREMEAARRAALPAVIGGYAGDGVYGDYYWMSGRLGRVWDIPMLPLTRISNPFFFSMQTRGVGLGRFSSRH